MAINPIPNFRLDNLSHTQLSAANKMVFKEVERVHRAASCNDNCDKCAQKEYCVWLHLLQLHIVKEINGEGTSSGDIELH